MLKIIALLEKNSDKTNTKNVTYLLLDPDKPSDFNSNNINNLTMTLANSYDPTLAGIVSIQDDLTHTHAHMHPHHNNDPIYHTHTIIADGEAADGEAADGEAAVKAAAAKAEADKAKAEADKAKAEAAVKAAAKAEAAVKAAAAKAEADKAKAEADKAKAEAAVKAVAAKAEADKAKAEADKAKAEADKSDTDRILGGLSINNFTFSSFDKDNKGYVTKSEFDSRIKELIIMLDTTSSITEAKKEELYNNLFEMIDINVKDDKITETEFNENYLKILEQPMIINNH